MQNLFKIKYFLSIAVFVGIVAAADYLIDGMRQESEEQLKKEIVYSVPDKTNNAKQQKKDQILFKPQTPKGEFLPPLPGPSEWRMVDDDDDEQDSLEKQDVISGIKITPETSPTPGLPSMTMVGASASPTASATTTRDDLTDKQVPFYNNEDLKQLEAQGADIAQSGLIGGSRSKLKRDLENLNPTPSATQDEQDSTDNIRYKGQTRGYTLLALMHPNARPMVERQLEILEKARLNRVYLSVLADGTFRLDYGYLEQVIRRINAAGMDLVLGIYFSNGPAMREEVERLRYRSSVNRYDPEEFREKIKFDTLLRQEFLELFRLAKPAYILNQSLSSGNANIAYVMLEDNLDASSYRALRELAASELEGLTNFMRNPCPGCYEGNDFDPDQDSLELHQADHLHALRPSDGYSMDGQSLFFPGEFDASGLSVEDTKLIIAASQQQGLSYFALWRAARQGIYAAARDHPDQRVFEVPTVEQEAIEIELLRYGLTEFNPDDDDEDDDTVRY